MSQSEEIFACFHIATKIDENIPGQMQGLVPTQASYTSYGANEYINALLIPVEVISKPLSPC